MIYDFDSNVLKRDPADPPQKQIDKIMRRLRTNAWKQETRKYPPSRTPPLTTKEYIAEYAFLNGRGLRFPTDFVYRDE